MYALHEEYQSTVAAPPAEVFARLDDHARLSSHMSQRSWKMGWGKMETVLDDQRGQSVGSHIVLRGRVFGISLHLDEVVIARDAPLGKAWETVGEPRLIVIGQYRMGFELRAANGRSSHLRVHIDYNIPDRGVSRILGRLFGRTYAQWCVRQMVRDAEQAFA